MQYLLHLLYRWVELYCHAFLYKLSATPLLSVVWSTSRGDWISLDEMVVYPTYLMLLLTWTVKQSLVKPIVTGGEVSRLHEQGTESEFIPTICKNLQSSQKVPSICRGLTKRGGEDFSKQILPEEIECCPVLEGCGKSIPLCSSLGGEDFSEQILPEEVECCPVLEGCGKSIPLCSSLNISE